MSRPGGLPRPGRSASHARRGEERPLTAWDSVHCPPGTEHAFVATADDPCIIIVAGAPRSSTAGTTFVNPRSELAPSATE
jgi:quercetin dioxygenase-like cupin family protein